MTYIKLEQAHTDDERWIGAGPDAFAVHVAALVYCDRQLLDGRISRAMALRVSLAVPADRAPAAIDALVSHEFWTEVATGYLIRGYEEHAFPADQIKRTRERWSQDKKRRRQHDVGDHSLCKDPKYCPAIRSTVESDPDSTGRGSHLYQTQPDQTQPEGLGVALDAAARSAGAPRPRLEAHLYNNDDSTDYDDCGTCHLPARHPCHQAGYVMDGEVHAWPEPHKVFDHPDGRSCCCLADDDPIHTAQDQRERTSA